MKYHSVIDYGRKHYYYNYSKETITNEVLVPFINGQVVLASSGNTKILINLKNVSRIKFFRTKAALSAKAGETIIQQMHKSSFQKYDCTQALIQETKLDLTSSQTYSLLQKSFADLKNQVFVIMKFGDKILDSAYEGVIVPLFNDYKIKVVRVDEIEDSGKISDQILDLISESRFILADLTGSRPNCYYETGFSHALGKEIILACHKNERIDFDLAGHRFIMWETESDYRKKLKTRIQNLIDK